MSKSPDSVLSAIDVNGDPVANNSLSATCRKMLDLNGYVLLTNLSPRFDHVGFLTGFGRFMPAANGTLVGDIAPEPNMDDVYYGGNRSALVPHTEGYEFSGLPPRYMALWCIRPAAENGETTLFDGRQLLEHLDTVELQHLTSQEYEWSSGEGLRREGVKYSAKHAILEVEDGAEILRFSANNIAVPEGDGITREFLSRGEKLFTDHHVKIQYCRHDLLLWDNWRMLHSRNEFRDSRRHLKRVQIA
ncbi:TauD/TfdA family dioxygenase [Streptomyces sp. NPDC048518]|uniref:TauD/TfdA family dioxygenase n=1 Tax=Streptomyces sp. NPDC048518 TaxID=3155029 RepID=UPI0033FD3C89